ncbi:MAG: sulfotransferase family protein [Gemmatimonadota bacterium]
MSPRPRIAAHLRMVTLEPARFGRQLSAAADILRRYLATPFASPNEDAIIVLGNPKTGTTAIAALLAEYGDLSVTLDLWPRLRRPEDLAAVHSGRMPFRQFVRRFRADFARDVVKDNHLTFLYPHLAQRFPGARFVMVMRDPRDTIRSILNRLELPGDLDDLGPEHYRRMRPLWEAIIKSPWLDVGAGSYVERLAGRWALAARVYLEHTEEMTLVRFEDFLADRAGAIARLAERLGVEKAGRIEDRLDTPYQPRGDRGVRWRTFFGPTNLAAIESRCAVEARALGYMD